MIKHFAKNESGRDFVVGDVHGCFALLQAALDQQNFDGAVDRLFSVGDLVDRGPESEKVLEWLSQPWFHAVRGNHEQMAIDHAAGYRSLSDYTQNGGAWMIAKTNAEGQLFADAFAAMPIAIEIETSEGLIGIVHGDCPTKSWDDLHAALEGPNRESFEGACMWTRDRIEGQDMSVIAGIHAVIVGHTPVVEPVHFGNVYYIDTGAVFGRELTLLQIQ